MNKFEELFAQYPFALNDEQVKAQTTDIIAKHAAENNNAAVWKQCLHQIDLTTLMGDDTYARVEKMASCVNHFADHYPALKDFNVASICVYPALVPVVKANLKAPGVGITSVVGGFPAAQTFIEIKVAVGDEVQPGDVVVVLEAMKMANNLEAEKGGKVTAILVKQGQSVMEDDALVVIE